MQGKVTQEMRRSRGIRERFPERQSDVSWVGGLLACGTGMGGPVVGRFLVC